jgi:flagellar hook assembly protein FlgD
MTALNPIAALPETTGAAAAGSSPQRGATADTFLQLLVAQLRTQNPLEPEKGTEFVTQLAQFNSLEQLIGIRAELDALLRSTTQGGATSGTSVRTSSGRPIPEAPTTQDHAR